MLNFNFRPLDSEWKLEHYRVIPNVVIEEGTAMSFNANGQLIPTPNTTTEIYGILMGDCKVTDTDHNDVNKIRAVKVPRTINALVEFAVGAGVLNQTKIGQKVVLNTPTDVNVGVTGGQIQIVGFSGPEILPSTVPASFSKGKGFILKM